MPKRLELEQVQKIFKREGHLLLSTEYINAFQKLTSMCEQGHIRTITLSNFRKNQECNECSTHGKFSIDAVSNFFGKEEYTLISKEYVGSREKLAVKCPEGHNWLVSLNKFKDQDHRCPECSFLGGYSRMEKELFDAISQKFPSAKKTKRRNIKIRGKPHIKGFDVDIFIPELNKGIEFDGKYFHSLEGLKRGYPNWPLQDLKNYHIIKDEYFKSIGIEIFHVHEEDWSVDKNYCIRQCLAFLARK